MNKLTISIMLILLLPVSVAVTFAKPDSQYLQDQEKSKSRHEVQNGVHQLETTPLKRGGEHKVVMDKEAEAYYQDAVVQEKKDTMLMDKEIVIFDQKAAQADKKALATMNKEAQKVEQEAEVIGRQADAAAIKQQSMHQDVKVSTDKKASELKQPPQQDQ